MQKTFLQEMSSSASLGYSASNTKSVKIGNPGFWITGLLLDFEIAITVSTPVATQDWLARGATGISLVGGGRQYLNFNTPDLRGLYWLVRHRMAGGARMPDFVSGSVTLKWQLPIIFAPNPLRYDNAQNSWDNIAGVAPDEDLTFSVVWPAATGQIGTGTSITQGATSLCRLTYFGIIPTSKQQLPKWYPEWAGTTWAPTQTYSGLGGVVSVSPGWWYRRTNVTVVTGTSPSDVRTDGSASDVTTGISEIGVQGLSGRPHFNVKMWDWSKRSQSFFQVADDNAGIPTGSVTFAAASTKTQHNIGTGVIDWGQFVDSDDKSAGNDPMFGLNLARTPDGQAKSDNNTKLAFTVDNTNSSTLNAIITHERYRRYPWA